MYFIFLDSIYIQVPFNVPNSTYEYYFSEIFVIFEDLENQYQITWDFSHLFVILLFSYYCILFKFKCLIFKQFNLFI
jgi:hypothetical protein